MKVTKLLLACTLLFSGAQAFAAQTQGLLQEVPCGSNPIFTANGCLANSIGSFQCFEAGSVKPGEAITGLSDRWTNTTTLEHVIYEDEIMYPKLVNLGGIGTNWVANPNDEKAFWNVGSDIIFTPETASGSTAKRNVFSLKAGKTVTVLESELSANYRIERSDKKAGDYVGMIKYPVNYRVVDATTGKPTAAVVHTECAAYKLAASVIAVAAPVAVVAPPPAVVKIPVPPQATAVKTGAADTFLFLGLAFLLGLAFMFARKRKSI